MPGWTFGMFTRKALILVLLLLSEGAFGQQAVKFVHYNVENYLEMNRRQGGRAEFGPKPESEKNTLVRIIKEIHPDILGVAEMGPPDQFDEFQKRLNDAGLEFPFSEYVNAADPNRHLALLSRFEIVERHSEKTLFFDLNGQREAVERGFLDVTIEVNQSYRLRLVGAHLKSKLAFTNTCGFVTCARKWRLVLNTRAENVALPTTRSNSTCCAASSWRAAPSGEALLRRNEARLLRQHIDAVLSKDPNVNLLVYGDLNDTKDQPAIQEILGPRQSPNRL